MRILKWFQQRDAEMSVRVGKARNNTVRLTGAACTGSFLLGCGKLIVGVLSASFFTCANAFYTFGMVAAKLCALKGIAVPASKQYSYYRITAGILIAASLCYAFYAFRLLLHPEQPHYNIYMGLPIAAFTFTEIGLNIRGILIERRSGQLMFHAIKMVNLASSLVCLVLTQTALLSFTAADAKQDFSAANGTMGLLMGSATALTGIFMFRHVSKLEKQEKNDDSHFSSRR